MSDEVQMTIDERRKYLQIMQPRYQAATRAAQGHLLTEMEQVTGLHRKSLIRLLRADLQRHARTHERGCKYDAEVEAALAVIVEAVDYVCAERVHGSLQEIVASLEAHDELPVTPGVRAKLAQISLNRSRRTALPSPGR
ncbi:MAG TPA: hypothetical protein PKH77_26140 [Anaerolineae bacterium]|nr:hypothetical protein [Anaerolineae bacterium]